MLSNANCRVATFENDVHQTFVDRQIESVQW